MMSDSDNSFNSNPFRELDASRFPKRAAKKSGAPGRKTREKAEPDADSELFLRAMARNVQRPTARRGFPLGEQCDLPRKPEKKKQPPLPPREPEQEDEESQAFLLAMRNAQPLPGKGRKIAPQPEAAPAKTVREPAFEDLLADSLTFSVSCSDEYLEGHVTGLDELIMNRLRQGQLSPEAHLDLHGLNSSQAFESLREFMRNAWFKGLRTILLVPGRGLNSPDGMGILRRKLQSWLTQEPFKRVVLAFCTAQPYDGGPGSIYVLLRKFRKKGRICWERLPADADLF